MLEKFWLVHSGYYRVFRNVLIAGGGFERVPMPFLFGVAHHAEHGPVLVDTPFDEKGPRNMGAIVAALMRGTGLRFEKEWSVPGRLAQLGYEPGDVRHVLITHLHADHTGGMDTLDEATFHISRVEWDHARDRSFLDSAMGEYAPEDFASLGDQMNCREDVPLLEQGEGLDVFGDGSVEMCSLPGHTPGHCVYRLHLEGGETVLYAGDAAHTIAHAMGEANPGVLPRQFTDSKTRAEEGLAAIRAHLEEHPDDALVLCHDPGLGDRVISAGGVVEWP